MKKFAMLLAGLAISMPVFAQNHFCFYYDAAGNRHFRETCCNECRVATPVVDVQDALPQIEEVGALRMSVVPNPTTGVFTLSSEDAPPEAPVFIYDAAGKLLIQSRLGAGHFDLSSYPPDVYFVRLVYAQKQKTLRLEKTER
jgi:hypothetical protein